MSPEEVVIELGTSLATRARMGDGVEVEDLVKLKAAMDRLREYWNGDQRIDRQTAGVLADPSPALESSAYLYRDAEGDYLRELAGEVAGAVASVFFPSEMN